mmetsp:Transcript_25042/g.38725  ORF Transcript_25042/g.38725 Transcript_25042/m.38725 type:complete len:1272 (+) Transcript_25042:178-3993(+)|eukprot:CAMPEP_0196823090 /NCGR_PEP_ID=MMETSP1362-20130617/86107_1 /TAXON_ID=163516 /ORGANISM="Leptocylindrus danicus, Strain CCMP1856" /LENGTH=1271 /DNA_ID=CAMNT_0042202853 /DNA_START=126 /DNA_END=3938 /DNA_ORIENTATION=-
MFEKTLTDLVRGIRATKRGTAVYISQCISEIKEEIKSTDIEVKANALQKMTFLQMMGYGMSPWASFACVEVMSSHRFAHKRIGYLSACQSFNQDTGDVIILCTNLLQKELKCSSSSAVQVYEAGLAINCLSNIVTRDLARDLLPEVMAMLRHPKPYLRKKAVLCLFKLFIKYPEGLRLSFQHIKALLLEDSDPAVVSCAVNVIAELSDKNGPKNYLLLAPQFFQLLTTSSNNWMLIKVVKLLGGLVSEEPRLARKLLEPLASIAKNTQAKSLLFEAVYTITLALPYSRKADGSVPASVPSIVALCSKTLRNLVEEMDQNLKYLGLVGFGSLMKSHPQAVIEHRTLIFQCLSDEDVTLRTRALELLTGMVTKKNLIELINQLMVHVDRAEGSYRDELVGKIVFMCSRDKYAQMADFSWYISILVRLSYVQDTSHGDLIASQIIDVSMRVLPVRVYAVRKMMKLILNHDFKTKTLMMDSLMVETLPSAAWVVGEYSLLIDDAYAMDEDADDGDGECEMELGNPAEGPYHAIIRSLLSISSFKLDSSTQAIFVQAAVKVFAACCISHKTSDGELEGCVAIMRSHLPYWTESNEFEVQERAFTLYQVLISLGVISEPLDLSKLNLGGDEEKANDENNATSSVERSHSNVDDDLLGLAMPEKSVTSVVSKEDVRRNDLKNIIPNGTAARCRQVAKTLKSLLIPDPMKPTSVKAQKRLELPKSICDLNAPVDVSLFSDLIQEDEARHRMKVSIEEVCFDQQRPAPSAGQGLQQNSGPTSFSGTQTEDMGFPSDKADSASTMLVSSNNKFQANTPFYLAGSEDNGQQQTLLDVQNHSNAFGTIQLDGFDDSDSSTNQKKKRRGRKKKKNGSAGKVDMAALERNKVVIYNSDDEDDPSPQYEAKLPHKSTQNEFQGLAMVDLSTPIDEADVLPTREHRQVPEKTERQSNSEMKHKKKRKKEKEKKEKKSKKNEAAVTNDLLDLGFAVDSAPNKSTISDAFDSLLAVDSSPAQRDDTPVVDPFASMKVGSIASQFDHSSPVISKQKSAGNRRPWIKGGLKVTDGQIDWSKVSLEYKVYDASAEIGGSRHAAMIAVRISNFSIGPLNDLSVSFEGVKQPISLGTLGPGETIESGRKIRFGPFYYKESISSFSTSIKGKLNASGCFTPCKISLPSGLLLMPVTDVSYDDIMQELTSRHWFNTSMKLQAQGSDIMTALASFLRAEIVGTNGGSGILATQFKGIEQVRLLVKEKPGTNVVKVEIKSTSDKLGKEISSDLKKVLW